MDGLDEHELRLSDGERDDVVAQLRQAMSEGRLDVSEFEDRSRQVYDAKVASDLDGVLSGLPVLAATSASTVVPTDQTSGKKWFLSILGDRTHRGDLDLGSGGVSISLLGDTTFDLSDLRAQHVNLTVFSLLGDVTLIVAPGTRVDAGGLLLLGDSDNDVGLAEPGAGQVVRYRVWGLIGDMKTRVARG